MRTHEQAPLGRCKTDRRDYHYPHPPTDDWPEAGDRLGRDHPGACMHAGRGRDGRLETFLPSGGQPESRVIDFTHLQITLHLPLQMVIGAQATK